MPSTCGLEQRFGPGRQACLPGGILGVYQPVGTQLKDYAIELAPIALSSYFRSAYPMDRDNGAVWAGKGFSTLLEGGVAGRLGWLRFALYPSVTWSQNRPFAISDTTVAGFSPYAYPWWAVAIDMPERFGSSALTSWSAGQSYVELSAPWGIAVGVSNENIQWGPSRRYPMLLGVSAPGFPHAYGRLRFNLPVFGRVTGRLIVGRLTESAFYTTDVTRERNLFASLRAEWAPRGPDGPQFTATSVTQQPWTGIPTPNELLKLVPTSTSQGVGGKKVDGIGALSALLPIHSIHARLFGTWGRGDFWLNTEDLITEPDHNQFWQVGFEKSWIPPMSDRPWTVSAEFISTAASSPQLGERGFSSSVYRYGGAVFGHTNDGQLLGASIGSGSRAGYVSIERGDTRNGWGVLAEHIDWDMDTNARYFAYRYGPSSQDREDLLGGMYHGPLRLAGIDVLHVDAMGGVSLRWNRQYVRFTGDMTGYRERETNLWLDLRLVWTP